MPDPIEIVLYAIGAVSLIGMLIGAIVLVWDTTTARRRQWRRWRK